MFEVFLTQECSLWIKIYIYITKYICLPFSDLFKCDWHKIYVWAQKLGVYLLGLLWYKSDTIIQIRLYKINKINKYLQNNIKLINL